MTRRVTEADLVRAERSLAMAPSLPKDVAAELIEEIRRLRADRAATLEELEAVLRRLRA